MVEPEKIKAVEEWPLPKNVRKLCGFLELANYNKKFIRNFSKIAAPLTLLTKKGGFEWSGLANEAFNSLKSVLTTAPVLALPDFEKKFIIECDASGVGIDAILMQSKQPVAYFSSVLKGNALFCQLMRRRCWL